MSFADQFLRKEKVADNTEAVLQLLNIISNPESKVLLTPDQASSVKSLQSRCSFQVKPLVEIYRDRLWAAWKKYEDPEMDLKTAISKHEENKVSESQARDKALKEAKSDGTSVVQTTVPPRDFHETIIEIQNAQYLIDPKTGVASANPLQYSKKIEWDDFMDEVHINPYSGTVDLYKTLLSLMEECARVGCTRDQLCKVYKMFVFHHMKESYNALSYEKDAETIFDILMGLLDVSGHLNKMKECLRMIKRKPHVGITTPIRAYQSIIAEVLSIQSPNSTEKENREQAMKEASKAVKFFTTKAVWAELQQWKESFKHKHHRFAMLSEVIDFINEIETQPGMRPSSTLTLDNQEVKIDLFLSDTQQNWSCQFGQGFDEIHEEDEEYEYEEEDYEEVHTSELSEMGPRYANLSSSPGSQYGNEASTIAAHDGRKTRQQPGPLTPGMARWGEHGHVSPTKKKGGKGKAKSTFPLRPSSNQGAGSSRGSGARPSDRKSRSTQRSSTSSSPSVPKASTSPVTPRSGAPSPSAEQPTRQGSSIPPRSGSASSTESSYKRGKSAERSESQIRRNRSPSVGRCWICWKRHPEGRCAYGKIKATSDMCKCGYGYHPRNKCLTPSVDQPAPARSSSKEKGSNKSSHPFMPQNNKGHPN